MTQTNPLTGEKEGGLITGDGLVGHNCMNSTVTDVYNELKHQEQQKDKEKGDGEGGEGEDGGGGGGEPGDGEGNGYGPGGKGFSTIDDHKWMHEPAQGSAERKAQEEAADKMAKALSDKGDMPQDLKDKKKAEDVGQSQGYSLMGGQTETAFTEEKGVKLKWIKLLKQIEPDILRKRGMFDSEQETWARPNRKTAAYHPDILLPGVKDDEPSRKAKPMIVLALDTSGSIGATTANKFVNLAKSIPMERVELKVCTFTTHYAELDLENPRFFSGGTDFSAVEDFIRKEVMPDNRERYPKAVIVITDGQAEFSTSAPKKEQYGSWHWLLEDGGYGSYNYGPSKKVGKNYQLKDFT
jgi:predicted metal-dependent peptidase